MDAISMLTQQHREVDQLFERIRQANGDEKISLLGQVSEKLTLHAEIEERHFYPFARRMGIQDMVDRSFQEHAEVKQLIAEILQIKRHDSRLDRDVQQLMTSVQEHVKEEESMLFPRLASVAMAEELRNVGIEMQRTMDALSEQELLKMAAQEGGAMSPE
jgi:hemerythrin superfamily protein